MSRLETRLKRLEKQLSPQTIFAVTIQQPGETAEQVLQRHRATYPNLAPVRFETIINLNKYHNEDGNHIPQAKTPNTTLL